MDPATTFCPQRCGPLAAALPDGQSEGTYGSTASLPSMATTKRQPWLTWRAVAMRFCFVPHCKRRIMEGSGRPTHCGALSIPGIRTEALSGPRSLDEECT
jgi:hypothetical protein